MQMIPHDDVADQLPAMAEHSALQAIDQPSSVRIVAHNLLPSVAPRHDVIDGALKFDPQSPWHVGTLDGGRSFVKRKTSNKVCHREAALRSRCSKN
jgi:hypothetical protein